MGAQVVAGFGTAVWKWRLCLHEYWLMRFCLSVLLLVMVSLWASISVVASIHKANVLDPASGFNINLRLQMAVGLMLFMGQCVFGSLYLLSIYRFWKLYRLLEYDPDQDGFTDSGSVDTWTWWKRVVGCSKLPRRANAYTAGISGGVAQGAAAAVHFVADDDVELGIASDSDSSSSSASTGSSFSDVEECVPSPQTASMQTHAFMPPRASTPPLCPPSTPPLGPASAAPVPSAPPGLPTLLSPAAFEDLWEELEEVGGFQATTTSLPPVNTLCRHLRAQGLAVVASGHDEEDLAMVFATAPAPASDPPYCLVQLTMQPENGALSVVLKASSGHDREVTAGMLHLSEVCGPLIPT